MDAVVGGGVEEGSLRRPAAEEGGGDEAAVLSTRNDPLSKSLQVRGRMGDVMLVMTNLNLRMNL